MRIDCESHFWTEDYVAYLRRRTEPPRQEKISEEKRILFYDASTPDLAVTHTARLEEELLDFANLRVQRLDENSIDVALVSLSGPCVEQFAPADALAQAKATNDVLYEMVQLFPSRFVGLATIAPTLPEESAEEIERCVTELGFRGVNIMSHVESDEPYLDHERYLPIFEAAERLGVPVNLHPHVPHASMIKPYLGYGWALPAPGLGFGHETAVHTLRLIYSGLFDQFPELKMTLGHFGEALTFWFYRIDFDFNKPWLAAASRPKIERRPSDYLKQNFWFNCSGNFLNSALTSCIYEVGTDRLTFATDYPWERMEDATEFIDQAPLSDLDREKIEWRNAAELYHLELSAREEVAG